MRILAGIFCGGLLVVACLFFLKKSEENSSVPPLENQPVLSAKTIPRPETIESERPVERKRSQKVLAETNSVESRVASLQELGTSSEPQSLEKIISSFGDPNPQIRKAAIEAATQFGSRDAIPALQEMVGKVEDPREKVAILDAIEFLKLPSLSEIRRPRRAE